MVVAEGHWRFTMSSGSSGHNVTAPELLYSILFLIRRMLAGVYGKLNWHHQSEGEIRSGMIRTALSPKPYPSGHSKAASSRASGPYNFILNIGISVDRYSLSHL